MNNTNPADWTDAEIARWMAERDGYTVYKKGGQWWLRQPNGAAVIAARCVSEQQAWAIAPKYTRSQDAAVAWLGRMGLEWMREPQQDGPTLITVYDQRHCGICNESPTCPTERALCNAGWAAVQAREASDAV